jgi:hypothetical protein
MTLRGEDKVKGGDELKNNRSLPARRINERQSEALPLTLRARGGERTLLR